MADEDLTTLGSTTNIGTTSGDTAVFSYVPPEEERVSGTGVYDSFLATQGANNDGGDGLSGSSEGFNWDVTGGPVLDEDNAKTSSLELSTLKVVTVSGVDYYEFRLDLVEQPNEVQLNELKIYLSTNEANPADFDPLTNSFPAGGSQTYTTVLDLDAGGDRTLLLEDHTSGGGRDDYKLLIPVSAFGDDASGYVTFYVNMGDPKEKGTPSDPYAEDGGFDEWGAITTSAPPPPPNAALQLTKTTTDLHTPPGTPAQDAGYILAGEDIQWTYSLTNVGQIAVDNVVIHDDQGELAYLAGDTDQDGVHDGGEDWTADGDADDDGILDVGETWRFTALGTAQVGEYTNNAYASAHRIDTDQNADSNNTSSTYFGAKVQIGIDKVTYDGLTNAAGVIAAFGAGSDSATILAGEDVTWIYKVTNQGNVALSGVSVSDSVGGVNPTLILGDDGDNVLQVGETWYFTASGTAIDTGAYSNTGTASGTFTDDAGHEASDNDSDTSGYYGAKVQIGIDKVTIDGTTTAALVAAAYAAGSDNATILAGETVTWIYKVTNEGNVALSGVGVTDSIGGVNPTLLAGDDGDNVLQVGETWYFTASGVAVANGYANTGTASGSYGDTAGHPATDTDTDTSGYFGADPSISVDKKTNGLDHDLNVFQGQAITWTYAVTNTGNVAISNVTLTDNPVGNLYLSGDTDKDWIKDAGESWIANGDANNDGKLDTTETWLFSKTGTAVLGNYTNTATVNGSFTDTAGHPAPVTDSDDSDYQGYSSRARSQGFWNSVADAWDNVANNEANSTKAKVKSGELSSADVNPRTDSYLLLGDSNANGLTDDAHDLKISISLAKSILAGATGGDARLILLQQAIAAQLNINNGTPQPNNLIDEAVMWLTKKGAWSGNGFTVDANNDGVVDQTGNALGGAKVATGGAAWGTPVDVFDGPTVSKVTGEGLKNALEWYDLGKLVATGPTAADSVAYFNGTNFVGEQPNDVDNFWLTLHAVGGLTGIIV